MNPDLVTDIFIKISEVRYLVATKEAKTIESTIIAIQEERKKAGVN